MDRKWWQAYDQTCWLCSCDFGPLPLPHHAHSWQAFWLEIVFVRRCWLWQCTRHNQLQGTCLRLTVLNPLLEFCGVLKGSVLYPGQQQRPSLYRCRHRFWLRQFYCSKFASISSLLRLCWTVTRTIRPFSPSLPVGFSSYGIWASFIRSTLLLPARLSASLALMQNTLKRLISEPMFSQSHSRHEAFIS